MSRSMKTFSDRKGGISAGDASRIHANADNQCPGQGVETTGVSDGHSLASAGGDSASGGDAGAATFNGLAIAALTVQDSRDRQRRWQR